MFLYSDRNGNFDLQAGSKQSQCEPIVTGPEEKQGRRPALMEVAALHAVAQATGELEPTPES